MKDLCAAFRAVYADLCDSVPDVDPQLLSQQNPYAPAQGAFPTSGDFVAYLLTGHLGYHLGQLVTWRAAAGLGPLSRSDTLAV
jgi:hypothetical protein